MDLQNKAESLARKGAASNAVRAQTDKQIKLDQWKHIQADCPLLAEFMQGMSAKTAEIFGQGKKAFAAVQTFNGGVEVVTGEFTPARRGVSGVFR